MATLYVENIPDELYEALRDRARRNRKSIAGEVIDLLERNVPTAAELQRRQQVFRKALKLSKQPPLTPGPFPSAEDDIREDRAR
jgi:plasmid stability protein